jgi:hypothetical protein
LSEKQATTSKMAVFIRVTAVLARGKIKGSGLNRTNPLKLLRG